MPRRDLLTSCSHLDMHFNTVDGNFQASLKNKNFDETDYSLTNGAAYFVEQNDFKEYKSKVRPPKKEVSWSLKSSGSSVLKCLERTRHANASAPWDTRALEVESRVQWGCLARGICSCCRVVQWISTAAKRE